MRCGSESPLSTPVPSSTIYTTLHWVEKQLVYDTTRDIALEPGSFAQHSFHKQMSSLRTGWTIRIPFGSRRQRKQRKLFAGTSSSAATLAQKICRHITPQLLQIGSNIHTVHVSKLHLTAGIRRPMGPSLPGGMCKVYGCPMLSELSKSNGQHMRTLGQTRAHTDGLMLRAWQ